MKTPILFFVLLILLCSFASAVAPITSTTTFVGDKGIQIEMNSREYYTFGEERWNIIHTFNKTNGIILNSTNSNVVCVNHLRNAQGFEIAQQIALKKDDYFYLNGSMGKNNPIGFYAYTIHCQDVKAGLGGYKSGFFEITESGRAESATPLFSLIVLVALLICFYLYLVKNFNVDIFEENGALKMFFVLLSFWLTLLPIYIFMLFNESFGMVSISNLMNSLWPYLIWINVAISFYFMMYFIVKMLKTLIIKNRRR